MVKLIALYKQPENKEKFDEHYFSTHVPITEKIPGLVENGSDKYYRQRHGGKSDYYLMCEMYYEDMDAFKAAMKTPEAKSFCKRFDVFCRRSRHLADR